MFSSRSLNCAILAVALLAGGCDRQTDSPAQPPAAAAPETPVGVLDRSHKGAPLPALTVKDAGGKPLKLAELTGKPVLINLWATWCGPCVVELPTLNAIAADAGAPVRVVTISQDSGDPGKVAAFLAERGGKALPAWIDPENDLSFHYQTGTLPTTVLYDAQGREVWRFVGGKEWNSAEAAKLIAEGA